MLRDVEDILDSWENTGLLQEYPDPFNLALILETQRRVNAKHGNPDRFAFLSLPSLVKLCKEHTDLFQGLIEFADCKDVYKLGQVPRGEDADICAQLITRILNLGLETVYFGGLVVQNGYVYLIADPLD